MTSGPGRKVAPAKARERRARSLADIDMVEIKVTVRPDQELRAARALAVNEDTAEVRIIYYYDTPLLDLFEAGVALRARLVKDDDDDSTVKFRPVDAAKIAEEWRQLKGFKLEADRVGRRVVCSASLAVMQKRDEIEAVAQGKRPIEKLFSQDQERFLGAFYPGVIDFGKLCVLGPIRVLRWKLTQKDFPHELTLEEWRLPDGEDLVEVSIKTTAAEATRARTQFDRHLRALGLDPEGAQKTKTRTALNCFAKAHRQAKP